MKKLPVARRAPLVICAIAFALLALAPAAQAAPANDQFANAEVLPALATSASGSVVEATKQAGEPDHAGDPGGHSVWFSWTPTSSGPVDISAISCFFNGFDTTLAVYTGSAVNGLALVGASDDGPPTFACANTNSLVELNVVAGTTYKIAVDGVGGSTGSFSLVLDGRPANDSFANAKVLTGLPAQDASASTKYATKEAGEPNHAGEPGGHSVWFSWTPDRSGLVSAYTCTIFGGDLDSVLAVYTGSAPDGLAPVASNDDGDQGCEEADSSTQFLAQAGTTYRIAVDGKDGSSGKFILYLEGPPDNDDFANPSSIAPELPASGIGSTFRATTESGEPAHAGIAGGHSVWFSWTPASSGPVAISTCGFGDNGGDTLLAVYTGSALNGLTSVASNDDSPSGCEQGDSAVQMNAIAGTTYRIAVDGKGGGPVPFDLFLRGIPSNDAFAGATILSPEPLPVFGGGDSMLASKEPGEPAHAGNPGGHSVWFSWTPATSGAVRISASTCGKSGDTLLAVYTGSAVGALTPVASNDDAAIPLCDATDSAVQIDAVAGTTYRIAVDRKGSGGGDFGLNIDGPPGNDDFANSFAHSSLLPVWAGVPATHLATKEPGEPNHAGNPGGHSVWSSWTASLDGPVEISTCTMEASQLDTLLAVYTGSAVDSLTPVASNDDGGSSCSPTDSTVQFTAVAGVTYRIVLDGKDGTVGPAQIRIEGIVTNDDLAKAPTLASVLPNGTSGSNRFATKQAAEPDHAGDLGGASVWFKWSAPRSGPVSIATCGSSFDTLLAVYTGSAINSLTQVASNDNGGVGCGEGSRVSFEAVANTAYRIAVDGAGGAQGSFELSIDPPPANDDLDRARTIKSLPRFFWGATVLGSKQAGEPDHAGDPGGHSVWFSWTAGDTGTVRLDTCEFADFDTLLAVYTGSSVTDLTPVASNDDGGDCGAGSELSFNAVAGTTYRIAADGAGGESGHFALEAAWLDSVQATLTVSKAGAGAGSVVSSPPGIDCGSSCTHQFEQGTAVTLTATPASGSTFAGWSGGGCSGTGTCQVTLAADATVIATFAPISSGGGGSDGGSGGGGGAGPILSPQPKPKPLKCKPGFKKGKGKGKKKCVKKKKSAKGKGKSRGGKR